MTKDPLSLAQGIKEEAKALGFDDVGIASAQGSAPDAHRVQEAADGRQGLEVLGAQPRPDLMVVDYAMPGMTGAEFIVHARERVGAVPVVLATGYADMAQVGRVLGTQSILIKPFEISALAACVARALAPAAAGGNPGTLR